MATSRFVLRYRGKGRPPRADVERIGGLPGAVVLESSSRMLLVEAEPDGLRQLVDTLHDWVMAPEQTYAVPDTRKQVEGPPE